MNFRKIALTLLVLAVCTVGSFAVARQGSMGSAPRPGPIDAAELERLSARTSLEQALLKAAAEKVRQEKRSAMTVEMPVTVRVTKVTAPTCYYVTCVRVGTKWEACQHRPCHEANPD